MQDWKMTDQIARPQKCRTEKRGTRKWRTRIWRTRTSAHRVSCSKDFKRDTLNCSAPLSLLLMSGSVYAMLSGDRFTKNSSCYLNFIISIGTVDRWFSLFVSSHYPMDVLTKVWFIWSVIFRSCIFRPCDLVRHIPFLHFRPPVTWSVIFRSCIFRAPQVATVAMETTQPIWNLLKLWTENWIRSLCQK